MSTKSTLYIFKMLTFKDVSFLLPWQSSVLSSGFGELGSSKLPSSAGAQTLEQLKSPGLGPLPSQQIGVSAVGGSSSVSTSSWDIKPLGSQTTVLSQFSKYTPHVPRGH